MHVFIGQNQAILRREICRPAYRAANALKIVLMLHHRLIKHATVKNVGFCAQRLPGCQHPLKHAKGIVCRALVAIKHLRFELHAMRMHRVDGDAIIPLLCPQEAWHMLRYIQKTYLKIPPHAGSLCWPICFRLSSKSPFPNMLAVEIPVTIRTSPFLLYSAKSLLANGI